MSELKDRVVLVTGASSGIGEATARLLAGAGARLALVARRKDRLEKLAAEVQGLALPTDMTDEAQVRQAVADTQARYGRLDALVNNAGVMLVGPIESASVDDWRRMLDLNVLALMIATQAVLPIMKAQGHGHILNISSVAGRRAVPGNAVYCATKFAVGAFSEALREETVLAGIKVTLIEPGMVSTELLEQISDAALRQAVQARYQAVETLRPSDVAEAIRYALMQPPHVTINEVLMRPAGQER